MSYRASDPGNVAERNTPGDETQEANTNPASSAASAIACPSGAEAKRANSSWVETVAHLRLHATGREGLGRLKTVSSPQIRCSRTDTSPTIKDSTAAP